MLSKRLRTREIDGRDCKRHCARQRFSHFKLQQSHDTHDPDAANLRLSFLRRRSKIVEIVSGGDIVFALTLSGVCAAFRGKKRLAFLNTTPDEVIRSLFFNKTSQSVITVSVYREDNFASLKCRNTRTPAHTHAQRVRASLSLKNRLCVCLVVRAALEYIRRGQPDAGFPIFTTECLKWPGFVEFDDVNGKVLTYSAPDHVYKVREEPQPHAQRSRTPLHLHLHHQPHLRLHTLTTTTPMHDHRYGAWPTMSCCTRYLART